MVEDVVASDESDSENPNSQPAPLDTDIEQYLETLLPDLRRIYKGDVETWRLAEYKKGGKSREGLKRKIGMGGFTMTQSKAILERLVRIFCPENDQNRIKKLRLVTYVLHPEALTRIIMMRQKIDLEAAEKVLMNHRSLRDDNFADLLLLKRQLLSSSGASM